VNIVVNTIGKPSEGWQKEVLDMYLQRIKAMTNLSENCFATPKRTKQNSINKLKHSEYKLLSQHIPKGAYVIALDENGPLYSSHAYARKLQQYNENHQTICYLIGGPDGLSEQIFEHTHEKLALGKFTLPHILARVILYEQLYRCLTLIHKHPYHR